MAVLHLSRPDKEVLWDHLLNSGTDFEQGAFAFCSVAKERTGLKLKAAFIKLLRSTDYSCQSPVYLELKPKVRANLITDAFKYDLSLVEFHSHPQSLVAAFSWSDIDGLEQTVPHMHWRLHRPYGAFVIGPHNFDGLMFQFGRAAPEIFALDVGGVHESPNGLSHRNWTI